MFTENQTNSRERNVDVECKPVSSQVRGNKTICIPLDNPEYQELVDFPSLYRIHIDNVYAKHPELFPLGMAEGYTLHDKLPYSIKLSDVRLRRIQLKTNGEVYTIRLSFVLPYMVGYRDDAENGLLLLNHGVPYWLVSHVCGRDDMYWERLKVKFNHNNLIGTIVKNSDKLPKYLLADEKHTWINGEKTFIGTKDKDHSYH